MFVWTLRMRFGQVCKKLAKFRSTFTHSPSMHRDQKILRKVSFLKMFSEHAGYVFDYFSVKLSPKFRQWFAQRSQIDWRTFRKKTFHQSVRLNMEKVVLTTLRASLCRMSEKSLLKIWIWTKNKKFKKSASSKGFLDT